jgi:RNA polymerase sigma factor, sigma-70 family
MEKNIDEIKNMTQHQLETLLSPFIEKERLKYNYINLPQSIYLSKLKEIEDTMDFSDGKIDVESMIKNCSKRYIVDTLEEENQAIKVVSNFIKKNIKPQNKYQDNIISFEKIVNFFHDFNCFPPPNLLIELIDKNDTLNKILQDVVENNLEILQKYDIDSKFSDDISKNFIELYCLKNNIEIKKDDDIQEEDYTEFITDITNTVYTDDSVKMYLQEIHKPILTKEQEKSLALRIRNGDEKAKELFIERNLRLVIKVARKYTGHGISFLDLIQEGNLGLIKAVDKFDVTKGYKFSTYATCWIRQSIQRSLGDKSRNIRLPVHLYEKVKKYELLKKELSLKFNREPTFEELSKKMRVSIDTIYKYERLEHDTISLNMIVGDEDSELEDFISLSTESIDNQFIEENLKDVIENLLKNSNLTTKEIDILKLRFGIGTNDPKTLEETGKIYGVSRERIRQIQEKALKKIRRSYNVKELAIYMDNPKEAQKNIDRYRLKYQQQSLQKIKLKDRKESELKMEMQEKTKRKSKDNLYEYFSDYSKPEVSKVISRLDEDELELLHKRYGDNLLEPVKNDIDADEKKVIISNIIPRIQRMLEGKKVRRRKNNQKPQSTIVEEKTEETVQPQNSLNKEDYKQILGIFHNPEFLEMTKKKPLDECLIMSLKLGYFQEKCFSTDAIADFLDVDKEYVINVTKQGLTSYKEKLNQMIDEAIIKETSDNKQPYVKLKDGTKR